MFSNGEIFSLDVGVQYLTFKISYFRFPVSIVLDKHFTHNNEQFGGCLIKIKQILTIF